MHEAILSELAALIEGSDSNVADYIGGEFHDDGDDDLGMSGDNVGDSSFCMGWNFNDEKLTVSDGTTSFAEGPAIPEADDDADIPNLTSMHRTFEEITGHARLPQSEYCIPSVGPALEGEMGKDGAQRAPHRGPSRELVTGENSAGSGDTD